MIRGFVTAEGRLRFGAGALLVVLPLVVTAEAVRMVFHAPYQPAIDFHQQYWPAGDRLLHGLSPYDRSWQNIDGGLAFPYPALAALAMAPFAALPRPVADVIFMLLLAGSLMLGIRLVGVRDWRVFAAVAAWSPFVSGWQTGNLTLLLAFGLTLLWRYRNRPAVAGVVVATVVSLKPFFWPLGLFLLATRRVRAFGWSIAAALLLNVVAWAVVGFSEFPRYLRLVGDVADVMFRRGYAPAAVAEHLGVAAVAATAAAVTLTLAVAVLAIRAGRAGRDAHALLLVVVTALLCTPVIWSHYFVALAVPLAVARPRLGAVWMAPLLLWLAPVAMPAPWEAALAWAVVAAVAVAVLRANVRSEERRGSVNSPGVGAGRPLPEVATA